MSDEKKAALVFIERADGGVLSVWNRNYHVWGLPGGKVEPGEQIIDAAVRELGEETGIFIGYSGLTLVDVSPTYSGSGRTCHTFRHSRDVPHYPVSVELGGGVGWMTRDFLANQGGDALRAAVGEWFQIFFGRIGK